MQTFLQQAGYKKYFFTQIIQQKSFQLFHAPNNYFDLTLEQRKDLLKAPSIDYLCKTIILENSAYDEKYKHPIYYPKYVSVVIQYVTKIQSEKVQNKHLKKKIVKYYRNFQNLNVQDNKAPRSKFHFRLVNDGLSNELSGYDHNAITPFNLKVDMPVIVSDKIKQLEYIWFGGGHTDVKLRINTEEFKEFADFTY